MPTLANRVRLYGTPTLLITPDWPEWSWFVFVTLFLRKGLRLWSFSLSRQTICFKYADNYPEYRVQRTTQFCSRVIDSIDGARRLRTADTDGARQHIFPLSPRQRQGISQ